MQRRTKTLLILPSRLSPKKLRNHQMMMSADGRFAAIVTRRKGRISLLHSNNRAGWVEIPVRGDPEITHVDEDTVRVTGLYAGGNTIMRGRYEFTFSPDGKLFAVRGCMSYPVAARNLPLSDEYHITWAGFPAKLYYDEKAGCWFMKSDANRLKEVIPGEVLAAKNSPDKRALLLFVEPDGAIETRESLLAFRKVLVVEQPEDGLFESIEPIALTSLAKKKMMPYVRSSVRTVFAGRFDLLGVYWSPRNEPCLLVEETPREGLKSRRVLITPYGEITMRDKAELRELVLDFDAKRVWYVEHRKGKCRLWQWSPEERTCIAEAAEIWNLVLSRDGDIEFRLRYNQITQGKKVQLAEMLA